MVMIPAKTPKEINSYYIQKAKSSFKARFDLLLYYRITNGNRGTISTNELDEFEINDYSDSLNEYIQVYWQQEENKTFNIRGRVIEDIYKDMKDWKENNKKNIDSLLKHYIENTFRKVFPRKDFDQLLEPEQKCEYCHITKEQIDVLINKRKLYKKHITRGWSLEIDRKEPNLEYTKKNCVMCCYWCNNAKTDEFSYEEFKKIGVEIEKTWRERLNS
jgi:5-methylcytosine-specific restriction endonuclease McrA